MHEYTANLSANTLQARSTSGRHQRCCCRQCWSKIRCRRCAARKLALRGRPAQERNVEHRAWQDDPASLCARRRLVGCPKNRQKKLIGSRRTARQRHESSSAVVHGVTQKTPVISRTVICVFDPMWTGETQIPHAKSVFSELDDRRNLDPLTGICALWRRPP